MICPRCFDDVGSEDDLQMHYLSSCNGSPPDDQLTGDAEVIFRWYKTVPVDEETTEVFMLTSFGEGDPVSLKWNSQEVHFQSEVLLVAPGNHQCQLVIGEDVHELTKFSIKPATKEITLTIKSESENLRAGESTDLVTEPTTIIRPNVVTDSVPNGESVNGESKDREASESRPWKATGIYQKLLKQQLEKTETSLAEEFDLSGDGNNRMSETGLDDQARPGSRGSRGDDPPPGSDRVSERGSAAGSIHDSWQGRNGGDAASDQEVAQLFEMNAGRRRSGQENAEQMFETGSHKSKSSVSSSQSSSKHSQRPGSAGAPRPGSRERSGSTERPMSHPQMREYAGSDHGSRASDRPPSGRSDDRGSAKSLQREPLVTQRTSPMSAASSRKSSGASGPVVTSLTNGTQEEGFKLDDPRRVTDLMEQIALLKRCLGEKDLEIARLEKELEETQQTNKTLLEEREHVVRETSSAAVAKREHDKRFDELLREKENLITEVIHLKKELEEGQRHSRSEESPRSSAADQVPGSLEFNPNDPGVLQRRISDLESQMNDLQEANECAVAELSKAEKKLLELKEENESYKTANKLTSDDYQGENRKLYKEIDRLKHNRYSGSSSLEDDVILLRTDLRSLRQEHDSLTDENSRLKDDIRDLKRRHKHIEHETSTLSRENTRLSEVGPREREELYSRLERYRKEKQEAMDEIHALKDQLSLITPTTPSKTYTPTLSASNPDHSKYYTPPEGRLSHSGSTLPSKFSPSRASKSLSASLSPPHRYHHAWDDSGKDSPASNTSDSTAVLTAGWHEDRVHEGFGAVDSLTAQIDKELQRKRDDSRGTRRSAKYSELEDYSTSGLEEVKPHVNGKSKKSRHHHRHQQSGNLSSSSSLSSLLDELDEITPYGAGSGNRRSHSTDRREKHSGRGDFTPITKASSVQTLDSFRTEDFTLDPMDTKTSSSRHSRQRSSSPVDTRVPPPAGFRSVAPKHLVTQHNRDILAHTVSEPFTFNFPSRPFAPRMAADINIGDMVKFSRPGGKISKGIVKYNGYLPGRNDTYLGVELEHEDGKHDGIFNNQRFFKCRPNKGVFVSFKKVIMVWGS